MSANITKKIDKDEKYRESKKVTLWGTFANALLTIFKFIAGFLGSSQAMIADAIHSLSDFGSDIVVLIGLKIAQKPVDKNHPYGHGRAETFSTLLVGVALLVLGSKILWEAATQILQQDFHKPGLIALFAAILSILIKEGMYQITIRKAEELHSSSLKANAWHHRTDALSSVAALIGIGGAMIKEEWLILDPIAAILVSILVVKVGGKIVGEAVSDFMESSAGDEVTEKIHNVASKTKNVLDVHSVKTRKVGSETFVDLHIEVNPQMTVTEGHDTAREVRKNIEEEVTGIGDVLVHIEPKDHRTCEEQKQIYENKIKEIIEIAQKIDGAKNIHDVVINEKYNSTTAELHVEINSNLDVATAHSIAKEIELHIIDLTEIKKVTVHIDPYNGE